MDLHQFTEIFGAIVTFASLLANFVSPETGVGKALHFVALNGRGIQAAVTTVSDLQDSKGLVKTTVKRSDDGRIRPLLAVALAIVVGLALPVLATQTNYPVTRTLPFNESTSGSFARVSVASSSTGTTVLAASADRRSFLVQNTGAVLLYCARGTTVSATAYAVILEPNAAAATDRGGQAWSVDGWGGAVRCLAASGTGLVGVDSF